MLFDAIQRTLGLSKGAQFELAPESGDDVGSSGCGEACNKYMCIYNIIYINRIYIHVYVCVYIYICDTNFGLTSDPCFGNHDNMMTIFCSDLFDISDPLRD